MMRNPEMLQRFNLNEMVIRPLLHNMSVLLIFIVPAITMRMFPEEKRAGTYELLLTSPVRIGEIVAGKFLGGLGARDSSWSRSRASSACCSSATATRSCR